MCGRFRNNMQGFSLQDDLKGMSLRHLEVFSTVVREGSYGNAGVEMQMSRTNVKRVCEEFEKIVDRRLLSEDGDRGLLPTPFGQGIFAKLGPLSTSLRKLEDGVRQLHHAGRVLKFGAEGGFFRGGLFTDYLGRLSVSGRFRSCFLRVDCKSAQKSLLAASCDVYFGLGLGDTERLDRVELGEIGWDVSRVGRGTLPKKPGDLDGEWCLVAEGDARICEELLEKFRRSGAKGGKVVDKESAFGAEQGTVVFTADMISPLGRKNSVCWPGYQFSALMRRRHPYADLKEMLCAGAGKEPADGH